MHMIVWIAISCGWELVQGDVDGAYHRGYELERLLYFRAPSGGLPEVDGQPAIAGGTFLVAQRSVPGLNARRKLYDRHKDGIEATSACVAF